MLCPKHHTTLPPKTLLGAGGGGAWEMTPGLLAWRKGFLYHCSPQLNNLWSQGQREDSLSETQGASHLPPSFPWQLSKESPLGHFQSPDLPTEIRQAKVFYQVSGNTLLHLFFNSIMLAGGGDLIYPKAMKWQPFLAVKYNNCCPYYVISFFKCLYFFLLSRKPVQYTIQWIFK